MALTIVGRDHGRFVSVTRAWPAGAVLLADLWVRSGFTDVRIGWGTCSYDLAGFRDRYDRMAGDARPNDEGELRF